MSSSSKSACGRSGLLTHQIGPGNFVEAYGVVQIFSHGGFDGTAQIAGRVTSVEQFPCSMVEFDHETGQYGLVGGEEGGDDQQGSDSDEEGGE